jgi:hypothetical protein
MVVSARVLLWLSLAACSFENGAGTTRDATTDSDGVIDVRADVLTSRGLVARYFIDETSLDVDPVALIDSAPNPLALPITYTPFIAYTQLPTGRGLSWSSAADDGRASVAIGTTKLAALAGATAWTFEIVVDVRSQGTQSRLIGVNDGVSGYGKASLLTGNATDLRLYMEPEVASWSGNVDLAVGRIVVHAVVDTTAATDRATLHVGGTRVMRTTSDYGTGTVPSFGASEFFTLGNVEGAARSFVGDIYYAAVYDVALTQPEIEVNAALLLANDDRP